MFDAYRLKRINNAKKLLGVGLKRQVKKQEFKNYKSHLMKNGIPELQSWEEVSKLDDTRKKILAAVTF